MSHPLLEARAMELAKEMQKILAACLLKDPETVREDLQKSIDIKTEIESFGFLVTWRATFDITMPDRIEVTVNLWKVRDSLTPEEQKMYDLWRLSKIKPKNPV